jgi:hypothetical protein
MIISFFRVYMKKTKTLEIGAIAVVATVLIASSILGSSDAYAKRYGQSNAQSGAVNNECNALTEIGSGDELLSNLLANTGVNCIGSNVQNQDSDGSAITSNPSASSHSSQVGTVNQEIPTPPPTPPTPPSELGCPDNTVWDITILDEAEMGGVEVGTVICLTEGLGNHPAFVIEPGAEGFTTDVNTNQPNVANCNAPQQQVAQVTSGTPPNPLSMGSLLCATVDLP